LVAVHPRDAKVVLPDATGAHVGPRLIVETKDEHDFDPSGRAFGTMLRADMEKISGGHWIPAVTPNVKFSMLRQQHFEQAQALLGEDFDRLFVVHALATGVREETRSFFAAHRIYWITIKDVVSDLLVWYPTVERKAGLRNTLVGDLLHLLVGYCGIKL
jgi:hypothetical protein